MAGRRPPGDRSGGFATAVGIALVLLGALLLWINLEGPRAFATLLEALPVAAAWWPALLIAWGAWKLIARLKTGRTTFGGWEILLLFLVILLGLSLSVFVRVMERTGLDRRLRAVAEWTGELAAPLPEHVFVSEREVPLPGAAAGPIGVVVSLPMGAILAEARAEAPAGDGTAPPRDASSAPVLGLRLVTRLRAPTREEGAAAAAAMDLTVERRPPDRHDAAGSRAPLRSGDEGGATAVVVVAVAPGGGDRATGRELIMELPPGVRLEAASERGPVRVRGPFAGVSARTARGPLEVSGARGGVVLQGRDGAIRAAGITGPVTIRGTRGAVEVEDVEGALGIESEDGPVWVRDARGEVAVIGLAASITVEDSAGPVRVESRVAPVSLREVAGDVHVRSDHGRVSAERLGGDLEVTTRTAAVVVEGVAGEFRLTGPDSDSAVREVRGPVTIRGGSGDLLAASLLGPVRVAAGTGSVTVRDFRDAVTVETGEGPVDLATATLSGSVEVTTAGGEVRVGLPGSASFSFRATDGGGTFEAPFPLEVEEGEDGAFRVAFGEGGGFPVRVAAGRGGVVIHEVDEASSVDAAAPPVRATPQGGP